MRKPPLNFIKSVGANSNQQQEPSDSQKYLLKLKKLRIRQNSKMVETKNIYKWDRKFVHPPPEFGKRKLEQPKLQYTVRVTSKLITDPTKVIASNPQVWLLALIWC